jgi:hypothetical protein
MKPDLVKMFVVAFMIGRILNNGRKSPVASGIIEARTIDIDFQRMRIE